MGKVVDSTHGGSLKELRARIEQLTVETEELKGERRRLTRESEQTTAEVKERKAEALPLLHPSRRGFFSLVGRSIRGVLGFFTDRLEWLPFMPVVIAPIAIFSAVFFGDCDESELSVFVVGSAITSVSDGAPVGSGCEMRIRPGAGEQCSFTLSCGAWMHESEYRCWEGSYVTEDSEGDETTHYYLIAGGVGTEGEFTFNENQRLVELKSEVGVTTIVLHSIEGYSRP